MTKTEDLTFINHLSANFGRLINKLNFLLEAKDLVEKTVNAEAKIMRRNTINSFHLEQYQDIYSFKVYSKTSLKSRE